MKKKTALAGAGINGPAVLFPDEPFEGVDAIAATTLKRLLQRFISHGGTVFPSSHVLEEVERLCTHLGLHRHRRLGASRSLPALRSRGEGFRADAPPLSPQQTLL